MFSNNDLKQIAARGISIKPLKNRSMILKTAFRLHGSRLRRQKKTVSVPLMKKKFMNSSPISIVLQKI